MKRSEAEREEPGGLARNARLRGVVRGLVTACCVLSSLSSCRLQLKRFDGGEIFYKRTCTSLRL
jgi:hypothetical protein